MPVRVLLVSSNLEIASEPEVGISPCVIRAREHRWGFRRITRDGIAVAVVWLVAAAAGVITYYQLRNQPFVHDANGYALAARSLADRGLLAEWYISDIRTYGYPLFLAGAFKVGGVLHVGDSTALFLLQWPIYVGSAWLVATSVVRDRRRQLFAFLSLAANPLLIVYTAQAFTETLSLTCLLFATASLGRASHSDRILFVSSGSFWGCFGARGGVPSVVTG